MAETSKLYVIDSVADDLEKPPEDLRKVLTEMSTKEAIISSTTRMMGDGFMKLGLEIKAKIQETGEVPRVVINTAVMEHYINAAGDRTKDALRVFKHMLTSGVEPNAYTYAIIIKALAAADLENRNFVAYAKNYFVGMLDRGMQPNEETYEAVLEGIGRGENEAEAEVERREFVENVKAKGFVLVLQKEAEEMAKPLPLKPEMDRRKEHVMKLFQDATKDCEDEVEARFRFKMIGENYDSLSHCASCLFKFLSTWLNEEATELFKPLFETHILPDEAVFTMVIHTYGCCRTLGHALKAYKRMLSYGITPSSCTYCVLIAILAKEPNCIGHAKELFLEMLDKGIKPFGRAFDAVLCGIARLESLEKWKELLEQIKHRGVMLEQDEGSLIEVMKFVKSSADLEKKTTHKEVMEKDLMHMAAAMVEDGNPDEAMEMLRINPMVIFYTGSIAVDINGGETERALQTYRDMLADGIPLISFTYTVLIKGLTADPNFFGEAKKCLLEMMDRGKQPNPATYTAVIEGFAREEDKAAEEEGKEFVELMMAKGFVPNAKAMREVLKGRPAPVIRRVLSIVLSKLNH